MANKGWSEIYRQMLEDRARDTGSAVVMGLIAVGIHLVGRLA